MTSYDLKPCPCCGSEAAMNHTSSGDDFVRCTDKQCALRTRNFHENAHGAMLNWNRRCADSFTANRLKCDGMYEACGECGLRVYEGDRYCGYCGARLVGDGQS